MYIVIVTTTYRRKAMNAKTTPLKTYREHERDLAVLTDLLTESLKRHAERSAAEPTNRGFIDELHEARRRMIQALAAISGTREETIEGWDLG
jgi:hypothetical protein